ncbi:hypothetical protein [Streptomyces coffeae]|uniref:Zinc-finger domain-containing protein n=1 Tax=Streptomyces coffeae TaxID=621382 RepID=A0ABS1NPS8_9ACTN|nr:hypothetical protein [Streptomyces coffeae]MBL1102096.1 hypothetical protein [Streptomyces coffeae]
MTATANEQHEGDAADQAWRAAIGHVAACPSCRILAGCERGDQLVRRYEEATRQARSGDAG